jgi:hypothetical protein
MLAGAGLCGRSGFLREEEVRQQHRSSGFSEEQAAMRQVSFTSSAYLLSLALAVGSGVLAAALNVALACGSTIMAVAQLHGAPPAWTPFAVWPIALAGGSIVNIAYSAWLLSEKKTWGLFRTYSLPEVLSPILGACLWMGGIALYSSGTTALGSLGISIGYAIYMITMVLSGQCAGLATGEWRALHGRVYRSLGLGVACLVCAVLTIGAARYLTP